MRYFDYRKVAREAAIHPDKLAVLCRLIRKDFPNDDMIHELHVLRACMAVRDGYARLEEILPAQSPTLASR
jgi:hypothetical protein